MTPTGVKVASAVNRSSGQSVKELKGELKAGLWQLIAEDLQRQF
jgi:hypothetical protein